jgi:pimeloyl-ACP methyl ester carboxylesterase
MKFLIRHLSLVTLFLVSCSTIPSRLSTLPTYTPPREITTMHVPYPVLLLHGLGQKSDVWSGEATKYFSKDLGLSNGGTLRVRSGVVQTNSAGNQDGDFYIVSFSNPYDSVAAWGKELETCVDFVLKQTGADRVILIGYSMGGLAARQYLTERYTDHHVKRLITVGTPHLGSPFAKVWTWKTDLEQCAASSNVLINTPCKAALSAIQGTEDDVPYNAPAVRDLRRPEDDGVFLTRLGKRAHPLDLEYVSVIGTIDMFNGASKLSEGFIQELLRKTLGVFGGGAPALFEPGDGVVSAKSQDIMNIEYFTIDANRRKAVRTVNVPTVHVEHLKRSTEVQRVALEDRPDFKGAEMVRMDDVPTLIVDFTDHIPTQCDVRVIAQSTVGGIVRTDTLTATRGTARLVRTNDGILSRFELPLRDPSAISALSTDMRITITNTWGNVATATKHW